MKAHSIRTFTTPLSSALILAISLATPSAVYADEYSDVCGGTQATSGQKASYCSAAKQSKDAAKKEKTLTLVYSAVAGTCAAACAATYASMGAAVTLNKVCNVGALGAAATDVIMTQNFTGAFMTAMSSGYSLTEGLGGGTVKFMGKDTGIQTSCVTAATSAFSAFTHNKSKTADDNTTASNLDSAKSVNDSTSNGYANGGLGAGSTPGGGTSLASTSSTATVLKPGASDSSATPSGSCSDTSTASGAANCAATADPKVAGLITNPDFQKAFEKTSGMKLDDFLKNGGNVSPNDAIQAAAGSALTGDASVQLGKAIAAVEKEVPNFDSDHAASYAGGGGSKSGSGDSDFNNMMSGLMGKLMPKSEQDKKLGVSEVKFSGPVRNLASVTAEDPTVSLFERVAFRYSHVTPRLLADPAKRSLSEWSVTSPTTTTQNKRN